MRFGTKLVALGLGSLLLVGAAGLAETVKISDVHLCCGACVKAINGAVAKVDGAEVSCDQDAGTVTINAPDIKTARNAVIAIAKAGYHGTIEESEVKFPEVKNVPEGKVKSLKLTGIHNCCPGCTSAVVDAIKEVEGVTGNDLKPRMDTFTVSGDFEAAALIKALEAAGFHVRISE